MDYVKFGSAGLKVSPLALGLGLRGQDSPEEAQRLIEHAIDKGINLIDCANVYSLLDTADPPGEAEMILGRVLKSKRDDLVITSKVTSRIGPGPNDFGYSRYHIMREVDRSLQRLQTDHVDVYILHQVDSDTPLEEALRAMDDLIRQGKTRYVGCSNFVPWQVCRGLWIQDRIGAAPFICLQNPYSLLNRSAEDEMFDLLEDQGLGMMAYSPLGVGLLSGAYEPDKPPPSDSLWGKKRQAYETMFTNLAARVYATIADIASKRAKTVAQVALNWVINQPRITVAISGSDTIDQLDDNLGALGWQLSDDELRQLDEISRPMQMTL